LTKQSGGEKKKKHKKGPRLGKLKLLIILGALAYAGVTFANQQSSLANQMQRQEELLAQEETLQREISFLNAELDFIGTDEYIERQARIRLGWLNPGEVKYAEGEAGAIVRQTAEPQSGETDPPEPTPTETPGQQNGEVPSGENEGAASAP
jgi:cell division protein FtsB